MAMFIYDLLTNICPKMLRNGVIDEKSKFWYQRALIKAIFVSQSMKVLETSSWVENVLNGHVYLGLVDEYTALKCSGTKLWAKN